MENIKQAKKKQKIEKILEESASSVLLFYSAFVFIILFSTYFNESVNGYD